jgi:hypothetical protein
MLIFFFQTNDEWIDRYPGATVLNLAFQFVDMIMTTVKGWVRARARERMGSKQPSLLGRRLSRHTYRVWHASLPARKGCKGEGIRVDCKKGAEKKGNLSFGRSGCLFTPHG